MKQLVFIPSQELRFNEYDRFLSKIDQGVYAFSWYMNAVSVKWGVISSHNQKVFLPVAFKSRPGYKNVYQPFFCMFTVPVNIYEEGMFRYLEGMQRNFSHVEIHLPFRYNGKLPDGMIATERVRQEMKMNSYAQVSKNYSENTLRSIKKAVKTGLSVKYGISPETVVKEFSKNKGGPYRDH